MATTYASGTLITSTWLNAVGLVAEDGTWGTIQNTFSGRSSYTVGINGRCSNQLFTINPLTVDATKKYSVSRIYANVLDSANGFYGYDYEILHKGSGTSYGVYGTVNASTGSGTVKATYCNAHASGTFSGDLVGAVSSVTVDGGVVPTNSIIHQMSYTGNVAFGTYLQPTVANQEITYGFAIGTNATVSGAAYCWLQNPTATTFGSFQALVSGAGTTIYSVDYYGNLRFSGVGQRIFGDFANATHASRTLFYNVNDNTNTTVGIAPRGTSTIGAVQVYGNSDVDNASYGKLQASTAAVTLSAGALGSGADTTMTLANNGINVIDVDALKNVTIAGNNGALATTATDGFLYVPTCAGTPTGAPTAKTGYAPIVVNTTNNKLYFYSGGAWRDAGP